MSIYRVISDCDFEFEESKEIYAVEIQHEFGSSILAYVVLHGFAGSFLLSYGVVPWASFWIVKDRSIFGTDCVPDSTSRREDAATVLGLGTFIVVFCYFLRIFGSPDGFPGNWDGDWGDGQNDRDNNELHRLAPAFPSDEPPLRPRRFWQRLVWWLFRR